MKKDYCEIYEHCFKLQELKVDWSRFEYKTKWESYKTKRQGKKKIDWFWIWFCIVFLIYLDKIHVWEYFFLLVSMTKLFKRWIAQIWLVEIKMV